jgi:hypothetical protein
MRTSLELRQLLAQRQTRRVFLGRSAQGLGELALASLLRPGWLAAATGPSDRWTGVVNPPHYPPTAKRAFLLRVATAKRPETRARRITECADLVSRGARIDR